MNTKSFLPCGGMLLLALLMAACPNPLSTSSRGSLSVSINNAVNPRTLAPAIDMTAAAYAVSGTGPNGAAFSQSASGGTLTVDGLAFGAWTVTVDALNAAGTRIGSGQASAIVHTGQTAVLQINVVPLEGNGALDVTVSWAGSQVQTPTIDASLTSSSGTVLPLSFSITGSVGRFSSGTIPAGYQTLAVLLKDSSLAVMGAVEVARIVAGQTTTGTYSFANVNQPGGTLVVNITPQMADPIPVSISGVTSSIGAGTPITAAASVSDGTAGVVYVWYLNGANVGFGPSCNLASPLAAGFYRLDVTAFATDAAGGTRAGSATQSFQVVPAGPTWSYPVTEFAPNAFDVSRDGAVTVVGMSGGQIRALCLNPDGSVRKPAFTVASYDAARYTLQFGVNVARAGMTGQSALTWCFGDPPSLSPDWQTWVAFLDAGGNPIGQAHLLDPAPVPGINRVADVRMSDTGLSAFIYEAQTSGAYRLIVYDADGTNRAAVDVGRGLLANGALGRAIGVRRTTGDIIVAGEAFVSGENATVRYFQRFSSRGVPVDASMVAAPELGPITPPWSQYMSIEYNDAGYAAFMANVDYTGTGARKIVFYSPGMALLASTPAFGVAISNDRILTTAHGDFITPVTTVPGSFLRQRFTQSGQYVSNSVNGGIMRLDGADNVYVLSGSTIVKNPFPL